jgi:hypothetical protein
MRTPGISNVRGAHAVRTPSAVVLVNCAGGAELEVVRDALHHSWRTPVVLIGKADLGTVALSLDADTGVVEVDGRRIRPAALWIRHGSAGAIAARAEPAGSVAAPAAEAWSGLLHHLAATVGTALPGPAPIATTQLTQAASLGVRTPRTVLTTDVAAALRQMRTPRVIVKTPDFRLAEPDPRAWAGYLPVVLDRAQGAPPRPAPSRPVVVQEYVAHARELRVYYLDGGICAFEVGKAEPAVMWTDPARVTVTRVDCPPVAAAAVRTLCTAWSLRYGAIDLLVTHTGEVVFLEANPDGDWLWYERKAGWHGVSFMAAVMVRELYVRGTAKGARMDISDAG